MIVSDLVLDEVRKRLSAQDAEWAIALLQATELPMLESDDRARERSRVHLACLKICNGEIAKFEQAVAIAKVDWRDVLVASGLGNLDWPHVLKSAGFPVP
ncbi:MAG TPA: hypothetical protein VF483_09805 [Gemmatimonadaceae bacterium]